MLCHVTWTALDIHGSEGMLVGLDGDIALVVLPGEKEPTALPIEAIDWAGNDREFKYKLCRRCYGTGTEKMSAQPEPNARPRAEEDAKRD